MPGLRTELLEWLDSSTYKRFVTEIAPAVKVRIFCLDIPPIKTFLNHNV